MFFYNDKKKLKTDAQYMNQIERSVLFKRFCLIALNNFEWINLPEPIKPRYIENSLFFYGSAVFTKSEEYGYIVLPCNQTGELDLYYEPSSWNVMGNSFIKKYDKDNSVYMRNNQFALPSISDVMYYADKIADVDRTISTNLNAHKMPRLFKGTSNQVLTLKNIYKKIEQNEPAIYVDNNVDSKAFDVFDTTAPYIIDKLNDYRKSLINDFYELYGYPTTQTEKNERLTMTESEVKVEFSDSGYVGTMLEYRKQACDEINKMFDFSGNNKIDVKINRYREKSDDYYKMEEMIMYQQTPKNERMSDEKEVEE